MKSYTINAVTLRDELSGAVIAASKDETLPAFTNVLMRGNAVGVEFAATDRYIIVSGTVTPATDSGNYSDIDVLIPASTVKTLIAALKGLRDHAQATVRVIDNTVTLHVPFTGAQISGTVTDSSQFPRNHHSLFPETFAAIDEIGVNPALFAKLDKIPARTDSAVFLKFAGATKPVTAEIDHATVTWKVIIMPVRRQA